MFSKFFKRKNKKIARPVEAAEQENVPKAYVEEQEVTIAQSVKQKEKARELIVSLCEQMVTFSREMDLVKQEYRLVTAYLNDIQLIEGLSAEEKEPILGSAREILKLTKARDAFLKMDKKLADVQFEQMREQELEIPGSISRLKKNEIFLEKVEKDLKYLEGEKLHQTLHRQDLQWEQKVIKKILFGTMAGFVGLEILIYFVRDFFGEFVSLVNLTVTAFFVMGMVFLVLRAMACVQKIRQCEINKNYAITLENHAKIRFVHTSNAINYVCEKYHVKNSKELEEMFQSYQEMVRELKKFEKANIELDFFKKELVKQLSAIWLYDAKVWVNHADALLDAREMVELKHKLITRRQRIRTRLEQGKESVEQMQNEVKANVHLLGEESADIQLIIDRMERINSNVL